MGKKDGPGLVEYAATLTATALVTMVVMFSLAACLLGVIVLAVGKLLHWF